uniref:Uncharacterized protein n=1 Tax=Timema bartmani TaxID=61472 RepID=A0A7R9EYS6_9NEOP|nr:unnamed protein product [Timema bartmani]
MADNLVTAGTVVPNSAGSSLPGPSQGRNIDKRRKRVRPSSPVIIENQEVVRPQPRFLVMSRVDDGEILKRISPFILERVINGAAKSEVSIRKLRDGTVMIRTINDVQTVNVMRITEIALSNSAHLQVKVEPHRFLNNFKGLVTCYDLDCVSIEEICDELALQHSSSRPVPLVTTRETPSQQAPKFVQEATPPMRSFPPPIPLRSPPRGTSPSPPRGSPPSPPLGPKLSAAVYKAGWDQDAIGFRHVWDSPSKGYPHIPRSSFSLEDMPISITQLAFFCIPGHAARSVNEPVGGVGSVLRGGSGGVPKVGPGDFPEVCLGGFFEEGASVVQVRGDDLCRLDGLNRFHLFSSIRLYEGSGNELPAGFDRTGPVDSKVSAVTKVSAMPHIGDNLYNTRIVDPGSSKAVVPNNLPKRAVLASSSSTVEPKTFHAGLNGMGREERVRSGTALGALSKLRQLPATAAGVAVFMHALFEFDL